MARPTASELNAHLADGGAVQVTTYGKSWLFERRHGGAFKESGGDLYMRRGRHWDCLSMGSLLLVGIRMGRYVHKRDAHGNLGDAILRAQRAALAD